MFTFAMDGALSLDSVLAPDQVPPRQPPRQSQQRQERDPRSRFLRQVSAMDRIEHPAGDGDLFPMFQSDNVDLF